MYIYVHMYIHVEDGFKPSVHGKVETWIRRVGDTIGPLHTPTGP